ncbi:28842_t:CDS:1, partial [Racocetra persica]
ILVTWKLTNIKFINCIPINFDGFEFHYDALNFNNNVPKDEIENIITCVSWGSGDDLIRHILEQWAENTNEQEISNITAAVMNVAQKLCSVVEFLKDKRTLRAMQ